jgi:oligopeptide transport system ATP-binding protein
LAAETVAKDAEVASCVAPFIEARSLKVHFLLQGGATLKAVDGVSFAIRKGKTLGLVGESGCGKSTTGRALVGLLKSTGGEVLYEGGDVESLGRTKKRRFVRDAQMIFQDPYSSLDPRMTVGDIVGEGLDIHRLFSGPARTERICELLDLVGLAREHADRFPHEFSGGQRQRIGIARSLAVEPSFIVCDEPISALDVSIQAQVVNLLLSLQSRLGLTYLFISHDLGMVKHVCEEVAVMYLGKLVETAPSAELYDRPMHPYTEALLSAIPIADPDKERSRRRILLSGDVPSPVNPPPGCRFAPRCPRAAALCREREPELRELSACHSVACHLA